MSDFKVNCPHCGYKNDFTGDNWLDELVDDSQDHDVPCQGCGETMVIAVHATYTLTAEMPDDE